MKRMSEVLCRELPIDEMELRHIILNETSCADDNLIASAISQVDALADALEDLINQVNNHYTDCNEPLINEKNAIDALNAYRGAK